ncbi:MAG TPA: tetratricopeptide repeat protein [Actinobacteria bacterium]|nr:tetratricopeptide repeat protein [Actinomycetota bacterium]
MNVEVLRLRDRLEQVERDLVEVDEQLVAGELDEATHARLTAAYRAEREEILAALAGTAEEPEATEDVGPSRRRMLVGGAILAVGMAVVAVFAISSLQDRPSDALGGVAGEVAAGAGVDLSEVTNEEMEAVVAANPEILGMRMALARRYFEAGEFDKALDHYMVVLEQEPNAEALANVGWMTFLSGRPDVAEPFAERAIELDPSYGPAYWFLANIRFVGLDDPDGAVEPLERLLEIENLPDEIRTEAEAMLAEARSR